MALANGFSVWSKIKSIQKPRPEAHFRTRPKTVCQCQLYSIFLCFIGITTLITEIDSAPCSYKIPDVREIVFDVPLDSNLEESNENDKIRGRRSVDDDDTFQSLRIHLHYDRASIDRLSPELQLFVNTSLLPEAVNYWQIALAVRPTQIPIRLNRKCLSNLYYMRAHEKRQSCVLGCKVETSCGEVIIPDEHLFQCRYCTSSYFENCGNMGPPDGIGVPDTDFLLYVSAVLSDRCKNVDTVAYAAHCQQEADLDRPIAGHVNLCPNALSTAAHDREVLISTVKHEILHALGFSAGLYAFFRDENGNPRTRRNRYNKPVSLNKERGYYNWDANTIKTIVRDDWWTAEGMISHPIHVMITPRVQQEAQLHFNCSTLEGAELENQGGDGTAFTHWEKRLFENEAMTGTHTQNPVYSRLTLALLEDSGWYKANYSAAEYLHWGRNLGCEFAMKSCGDWIRTRREKNLLPVPFCDEIKHDGKRSLATTRCTALRDSLALCNLMPYRHPIPMEYRNFVLLDEVQNGNTVYYGGSVELADYCPYNQEFEWKASNSTDRRDSRCELVGNFAPIHTNSILEVYGNQSKCFDLATLWTERKCGHIRTFMQYKAGCYQYECHEGRLHISVFNESLSYPCYFVGQYIHIKKIINGWLREGIIICPPCNEICRPENFPVDDKYGFCQDEIEENIPEYVGDEIIDEPCQAAINFSYTAVSVLLFITFTQTFMHFHGF
ncbi:unnamed protein product [Thelazia callipaeda]|uniref:Leishmanolysin-like peptidase n=1 Tax=Thelazia callipaeda TaxID=103827 RepID=A0A0N5CXK2_THECL|nr:unnamed protein product [Thelazia callipaeda]